MKRLGRVGHGKVMTTTDKLVLSLRQLSTLSSEELATRVAHLTYQLQAALNEQVERLAREPRIPTDDEILAFEEAHEEQPHYESDPYEGDRHTTNGDCHCNWCISPANDEEYDDLE